MAGDVVDVAARRNANAAHLRGQRVADVIAVEVQRGDHVEFVGARQDLLERDVGNCILDQNLALCQLGFLLFVGRRFALGLLGALPLIPCVCLVAEFAFGQRVAPVAERAFGKLHDVALVHEGHTLAPVDDGIADRRADQALAAFPGNGLDADARRVREANLAEFLGERLFEHRQEFPVGLRALLEFDAGVNVFRVLAEDHHIDLFWALHGGGDALEPAHWAQAHVQIEQLPEGHVERSDAAADWRGERPLDADQVFAEGFHRFIGQPVVDGVKGLFAGQHFFPRNSARAFVGFFHRRVHHAHTGAPDVRPGAIPFDERDDRVIGHTERAVLDRNFLSLKCHRIRLLCKIRSPRL